MIGLGTIPGCSGIEAGRWLSPGDVVELSAGPLGRLRTTVGEPEPWRRPGAMTRARWSVVVRGGRGGGPPRRPGALDPAASAAADGVLAPNRLLDQVERREVPGGARPEDVVFDAAGRLYAGVEDGRIWRWPAGFPESGAAELFADTHDRPLGPAAGRPGPFASNLPSLPDNMSAAGDGTYCVAFPSPRLPLIDRVMPHPAPRRVVARLPERLQPAAQRYGLVVRVGTDGLITQSLHGPSGSFREIVGVRQHGGWLYLGSLYEAAVGQVPVPPAASLPQQELFETPMPK